jgi:anti-sigma regulatory factor (Ser/Thr protein kinase)
MCGGFCRGTPMKGASQMLTLNTTGYELYIPDAESADGCFITDSHGKRYADMESGVWALPLGHNHSRVQKAMLDQSAKLIHTGYRYTSPTVEQASEALLEITGHRDGKCLFLSSGSEAVDLAMRIAKITAEKPLMLRLDKHYLSAYGLTSDERNWVTLDPRAADAAAAYDIPFEKIGVFVLEPGNASGTVNLPPAGLIKDIAEKITKESVPGNIRVNVKVTDDARQIQADSYYLNRILYNLVTNSVQAMPKGGNISIEAKKEGKDIVLSVSDTGVGIPKEAQAKMFTVMFTTKSKGQGFGLPVVKRSLKIKISLGVQWVASQTLSTFLYI